MFQDLLTIIHIQSRENPYFDYVIDQISSFCDDIMIVDSNDFLHMRGNNYYHEKIENLLGEIDSIRPDFVLSVNGDEIPERRFNFMKSSLLLNEFVNVWSFQPIYLWNDLKTRRVDKLWNAEEAFPSLFRYIPEIDYKWNDGVPIPENQPGPIEKSGLLIKDLGFVTPQQRQEKYLSYLSMKNILNYSTQRHMESIHDPFPELQRLSE